MFVTFISSLSSEAGELRFGTPTPHLNATKYSEGIFKILLWGLNYGVFGVAHSAMAWSFFGCLI